MAKALTEVLSMLVRQTDYQSNKSISVFSFKFATFVSHSRKVYVNTKASLLPYYSITYDILNTKAYYFFL